ncbi:MAG: DAK2 domain-containing protein [Acidimicrobiales bacterium]
MTVHARLGASEIADVIRTYSGALGLHRAAINRLNVYPVPDGDTGTNMSLTLESVSAEIADADDLASVCKAISHGSLMGARGNSGVILSQLLRGFADTILRAGGLDVESLADALHNASEAAYGAVMRPVEGTILTVAAAASEAAREAAGRGDELVTALEVIRDRAAATLARTPEMLEVLATAGVVDAGGAGFVLFVDSMLTVVDGRPLPEPEVTTGDVHAGSVGTGSAAAAGADKDIADLRYEVMFLLDADDTRIGDFREAWGVVGDSIVVVGGDGLWNCHIHTDDIGASIEAGIAVGRPHNIRVTDLLDEVDHVEDVAPPGAAGSLDGAVEGLFVGHHEPTRTAVVAVGAGDGVRRIFESLGVQAVVVGGQTMNPSTEMLVRAAEAVSAEQIVVLPNNKNIVPVAHQVAGFTARPVKVVETRSVAEGFAALLAFDPEADAETNEAAMTAAAAAVVSGDVTRAVRDATTAVGPVVSGDHLGLDRAGVRVVAGDLVTATTGLLDALVGDDHEIVTLIEGTEADDASTTAIVSWLAEHRPHVEVEVHDGGQPLYPYHVGVE